MENQPPLTSPKEWEYLGGDRDLYKDVVMENEPPLTSPDGSSKRNPPERCPRPVYSRDSTQEDLTVPHHDQHENLNEMKIEVKEEEEETYVMGHQQSMEEGEMMVTVKQEEPSLDVGTDGSSKRNPPERCPRPLYSRDSTQEDLSVPHHDQQEEQMYIKVEVKEEKEETHVMGYQETTEEVGMRAEMKQEEPPLDIITDGSSKRNPPERCPRPLYSRDSTQEDLTVPHHDQGEELKDIKVEVKEEEEETLVSGAQPPLTSPDGSSKRNPPEGCPCPMDSTQEDHNYAQNDQGEDLLNIKIEVKTEEEETYVTGNQCMENGEKMVPVKEEESPNVKMENEPPLTSPDGSSKRNPPERCPRPLYSRDPTQEDLTIPHHDQHEELIDVKIEVKEEEETYVREDHQPTEEVVGMVTEEESSLNINPGTSGTRNTSEGHLILSPCYNGFTQYPPGLILLTPIIQHRPSHLVITTKPSNPKESSSRQEGAQTIESSLTCSVCGKMFTEFKDLCRHKKNHTSERPFPCTECGKRFTEKRFVLRHQKSHTGERPFPCLECGKSFSLKENLLRHQRSHTGERPYSCSECGRGFSSKDNLVRHQRIHTGERPFSCLECGSSFTARGDLRNHERTHTGERPYSCSVCGKRFILRGTLVRHQKTHIG